MRESIAELRRAQAEGASVSPLIALLEQIVLALSQRESPGNVAGY